MTTCCGHHWVRGSAMGWAPKMRTFPALSASLRPPATGYKKLWIRISAGSPPSNHLGHSGSKTEDATIRFLENPTTELSEQQRQLRMLQQVNKNTLAQNNHPQIDGVIRSYEMAFRMQNLAPDVINIANESKPLASCMDWTEKKQQTSHIAACLHAVL